MSKCTYVLLKVSVCLQKDVHIFAESNFKNFNNFFSVLCLILFKHSTCSNVQTLHSTIK